MTHERRSRRLSIDMQGVRPQAIKAGDIPKIKVENVTLMPGKGPEEFSKDAGSTGKLMSPMFDTPETPHLSQTLEIAALRSFDGRRAASFDLGG